MCKDDFCQYAPGAQNENYELFPPEIEESI